MGRHERNFKRNSATEAVRKAAHIADYTTACLEGFISDRPDSEAQLGYLNAVLEYGRMFGCSPVTYAVAEALAKSTAIALKVTREGA
jgi:hypothetical protein